MQTQNFHADPVDRTLRAKGKTRLFSSPSVWILLECLAAFLVRVQFFVYCLFPRRHFSIQEINESETAGLLLSASWLKKKIPGGGCWHSLSQKSSSKFKCLLLLVDFSLICSPCFYDKYIIIFYTSYITIAGNNQLWWSWLLHAFCILWYKQQISRKAHWPQENQIYIMYTYNSIL